MHAHARLLGRPGIDVAGARLSPPPSHGATIVLYLADRGDWTPRDEVAALLARARVALARGDGDEVRRACTAGMRAAGSAPAPLRAELRGACHGVLGHLALLEGELGSADDHLERAGDAPVNVARRAWLLLARGRDEAAIADLRAALERVPYPFLHPFSYGFAGTLLALALAAAGERRDARRAAKRVLRQAAQARRPTPASASYDGRHDEALVARAERALARADRTR